MSVTRERGKRRSTERDNIAHAAKSRAGQTCNGSSLPYLVNLSRLSDRPIERHGTPACTVEVQPSGLALTTNRHLVSYCCSNDLVHSRLIRWQPKHNRFLSGCCCCCGGRAANSSATDRASGAFDKAMRIHQTTTRPRVCSLTHSLPLSVRTYPRHLPPPTQCASFLPGCCYCCFVFSGTATTVGPLSIGGHNQQNYC